MTGPRWTELVPSPADAAGKPKVVLAYSGGLDTSVTAGWLGRERGFDVVAVLVDVGQAWVEDELRARAAAAGARLLAVDARQAFVDGYCWPALQANALYEGTYPLISSLARPLIAAVVVDVARAVGANAVAHGCTGKGNDQVRFETTFAALAPELEMLAPVRELAMSRDEAKARAGAWGIPLATEAKVYSIDENLWGRTAECGPLEDPWAEPPPDAFGVTVAPPDAPDVTQEVVVGFDAGHPVTLDGVPRAPLDLIASLGETAGRHGFGRIDMIENRLVGIKSREVYEAPAALALIAAHRDLESLTLERDLAHEKAGVERRWAELAYYGQWHGPLHASLRSFVASTQDAVSGEVRLRFYKGSCTVVGRRSERSLYQPSLATYDGAADRFDHRHAEGFVRLWSLPIRTWASIQRDPSGTARGAEPNADRAPASVAEPPATAAAPPPPPASVISNGHAPVTGGRPLWAGRFSEAPSAEAAAFTRSLAFDVRLAPYDVRATAAHAFALHGAGVLSQDERDQIARALDDIGEELAAGTFDVDDADEDIHSAIERALIDRLGEVGAKIHAGRSRNDLVVTDLRMWTKDAAAQVAAATRHLARGLADRAAEHPDAVMPGYTHLQQAQPVLLAHHLLAHAFALLRDAERFDFAAAGADVSALGAGALAGSTIPLDVAATADRLRFARVFDNSIDAVSDRDFALAFLSACAILGVHLSRLAEDIVLWCTSEFGFAVPSDEHATGSSMMPQKRNPDVAELARGKAGRLLGDFVALATAMKGLPLAYDRDLQEDKEPMFDAFDTLALALPAVAQLMGGLRFDIERMREAASGSLLATDVAERLVRQGMPFREAHGAVGAMVATLEAQGRTIADLRADEWRAMAPGEGAFAEGSLTLDAAIDRRVTRGGTGRASVEAQLATIAERLAAS